jgi:hypothetical protein
MADKMNTTRIPQTDSNGASARFLDEHDFTGLEDELGEVTEGIFERGNVDWDAFVQFKVQTGISDLAHQHDHYLYGKPKAG